MQETESKTEEKSTGSDTDTSGSDFWEGDQTMAAEAKANAPLKADSEKELDYFETELKYGKRIVGEMRLLLFEDETVLVSFPNLGRLTPGRLEKAMPRIFRECMTARAIAYRESVGLPTEFVTDERS